MRPVKLVMSAFGPYADTTEIEFDALGTSGVYLVCGDTGSGKTMIFDALCFALFGEASGDARDGARTTASMRSDYATPTSKTFVELHFEYRGSLYRVKRNPDYTRAKARGQGETKQVAGAEMEMPDGRVVTGVRKVNAAVEELLGISADQFKQIVMLAQGEFRRLLTADTDTREGIFRKLFGTELYERVQERLAEECRKLERKSAVLGAQIATLAEQARLPELDQDGDETVSEASAKSGSGAELEQRLEQALAADAPVCERLDEEVEALRVKWSEANVVLKQVEQRSRLEQQQRSLEEALAQLAREAPALHAAFEQQAAQDAVYDVLAQRAALVEASYPKYGALEEARRDMRAAAEAAQEAARLLEEAQKAQGDVSQRAESLAVELNALEGADVRFAQAQAAFESVDERYRAAREALGAAEELEKKELAAREAAQSGEAMRRRYEEARTAHEAKAQELQAAQEAADALGDAETVLVEAQARYAAADRDFKDAQALERRRGELVSACERAEAPYAEKLTELKRAENAHDADAAELHDVQKRQRAGRAGLLAADLEEGAPCPVCGSTVHPAPAATEDVIPDDDEVDAAAAREAASKQAATELSIEAERLKTVLERSREALAAFDGEQGGAEALSARTAKARAELEAANRQRVLAEERKRAAREANGALETVRRALAEAAKRLDETHDAYQEARERSIAAEHAARALREAASVTDAKTARSACESLESQRLEATAKLAAAQGDAERLAAKAKEKERVDEEFAACVRRVAELRDDSTRKEGARALAAEKAEHLKADVEFESLEAAQSEVRRARDEVAAFRQARDAAEKAASANAAAQVTQRELIKANSEQLQELPAQDPVAVNDLMTSYQERANELKGETEQLKARMSVNEKCLENLRDTLAKVGDVEQRYGRVKLLADAATGNLVGQPKVRFEAYVQAIYFDKVIDAANRRLKLLTSGQFELVRYSEGAGNAKAGLGLYVVDSFTGRAREASSLSGGESFQASLCLALGLSDIVQAHAGGVEFDTMFVDEGFGSLDQGSLGNAISLLSDLSGSTKLVGIISHVEDLKANIPKKIVVTKTRAGSSVHMDL